MSHQSKLQQKQVLIFVLCWTAYAGIYLCRVNLSVAMPVMQTGLTISKTQLGLMGSGFLYIYGLGQVINGFMGDRISSRWYVFTGVFIAGLCNIILSLLSNPSLFVLLWAMNEFAQSMVWGPMVKALTAWFPPRLNGKVAIGISTSMTIGYMISWALSSLMVYRRGWSALLVRFRAHRNRNDRNTGNGHRRGFLYLVSGHKKDELMVRHRYLHGSLPLSAQSV